MIYSNLVSFRKERILSLAWTTWIFKFLFLLSFNISFGECQHWLHIFFLCVCACVHRRKSYTNFTCPRPLQGTKNQRCFACPFFLCKDGHLKCMKFMFFSHSYLKKVAVKRTYVSFLWYRKKEENILKNKDILGRFKIFSWRS